MSLEKSHLIGYKTQKYFINKSLKMKPRKLFLKILNGSLNNIHFADFRALVEAFGFHLSRINGSHYIFTHPDVDEMVNIQDENGDAKPLSNSSIH
jgi:hypothetical protein